MRIVDDDLLAEFRFAACCESCGKRLERKAQPHHLWCRGAGGGSRLDIRCNLIALGDAFECDCHAKAQPHRDFNDSLIAVVARREGLLPEDVGKLVNWLLRMPKCHQSHAQAELARHVEARRRWLKEVEVVLP